MFLLEVAAKEKGQTEKNVGKKTDEIYKTGPKGDIFRFNYNQYDLFYLDTE